MLEFDAKTTRLFDTVYQGADVTQRRRASFDALRVGPGETILDIGCGNGFLTVELARAVGQTGRIIGVDPSADMRHSAQERCAGFDWVDIVDGTTSALSVKPGSVDKAVSVQVFEYLDDLPGAARTVHRALKSGGRLVVGDIHFDSLIWFSGHPERMARMVAAWDHHLVERAVPALLPAILRDAGFVVEDIRPATLCDHQLRADGLASMMMILMENYATSNGHIAPNEAHDWAEEQRSLAAQGRFFFSITHFVITARKP
jgi:arsenite methyltransferase